MATAVELFGKTPRELRDDYLRSHPQESPKEIAEKAAEYLRACGFEPIINEENKISPTRWPHPEEPLRLPFSPPATNTKTTKFLDESLAQMHASYQSRSPFARFEETRKDMEKSKPRRRQNKEATIRRFLEQQEKLF